MSTKSKSPLGSVIARTMTNRIKNIKADQEEAESEVQVKKDLKAKEKARIPLNGAANSAMARKLANCLKPDPE